jgi:hypothetical protein
MRQKPIDSEKFSAMKKVLKQAADTKDDLHKISIVYIMDESYPREDIALCIKEIKLENGWH